MYNFSSKTKIRSKSGKISIPVIVAGLVVSFVCFSLYLTRFNPERPNARLKVCVQRMNMINEAVESYALEPGVGNSFDGGPFDKTTTLADKLLEKKYLDKILTCKYKGNYFLVTGPETMEISCSDHGTVNDPRTDDYPEPLNQRILRKLRSW